MRLPAVDVAALQVAAELREHAALQQIGSIVSSLRQQGVDDPLRQVRYAVGEAGHVYFDVPGDGPSEGSQMPGQYVIPKVLDLQVMDARILGALGLPEDMHGRIETRRGRMGSKPVFAGTRLPVATIIATSAPVAASTRS